MRFVSLHSHTTFSFGDGYGPVEDHVRRVSELGMTALGVSEHGNVSSHVQLEKACDKYGVKPIFGCELYMAPSEAGTGGIDSVTPVKTRKKFHQTVFAKNQVGLTNLNRLVSASWRDHFFQWPTVTFGLLKEHSEGLVVLSGCADSLLSCTLLGGKELGPKRDRATESDLDRAQKIIEVYQGVFGDDYYLECQRFPKLERICELNQAWETLSARTGAKLCATSDVHYPLLKDRDMQIILHSAHRGGTVEDAESGDWHYDAADLTYPESDQEIYRDLRRTGLSARAAKRAILNTERIAEKCTVKLPVNDPISYQPTEKDWERWT